MMHKIDLLRQASLVAVLRGITPDEIIPVSQAIVTNGWQAIEVTLNSPDAYTSLQILKDHFQGQCLIGAGTVLNPQQVEKIAKIGLDFVISPNTNTDVIKTTKSAGMLSIPGIFTPSEAFTALDDGADALKIFPGECISLKFIKAIRAVLPREVILFVTGGVTPDNMNDFFKYGVTGFGIGGGLYKPQDPIDLIANKAKKYHTIIEQYQDFGINLE